MLPGSAAAVAAAAASDAATAAIRMPGNVTAGAKKGSGAAPRGPLISELDGRGRPKPAVKAGFLNAQAKGGLELYPQGSAEGIPPPAPNPVANLPDSLRSKCHVINTAEMAPDALHATMAEYGRVAARPRHHSTVVG